MHGSNIRWRRRAQATKLRLAGRFEGRKSWRARAAALAAHRVEVEVVPVELRRSGNPQAIAEPGKDQAVLSSSVRLTVSASRCGADNGTVTE